MNQKSSLRETARNVSRVLTGDTRRFFGFDGGGHRGPGPEMEMMMMCSMGRDAAASAALANANGDIRAQQEVFRNFTNELSNDLFSEAAGLYSQLALGAVELGIVRAEAASGTFSYVLGRHGPVFGSNFYRGEGRAGFMNQGRLPNNFRVGFSFRGRDQSVVFRAATCTKKNTKHFDNCTMGR